MLHKRSIALLAAASICVASCQKEMKNAGEHTLQPSQKIANVMDNLNAKATSYRTSSEKSYQVVCNKQKALKQNIEQLVLQRNGRLNKAGVLSNANSNKKSVIHIPSDYPTLQSAVDNSQEGGTIILDGTVLQSGNVMVDVPNLTIQGGGAGQSSAINGNSNAGDNLVITVPGVTVNNLTLLNIGILISNTQNEIITNLKLTNTNPTIFSVILLLSSNNNLVKNCGINGGSLSQGSGLGVFLDDFSNSNEVDNCVVSNTQFAAFGIEGSNNQVNNCQALNFIRGFISFDGVSTGNVYTGCEASHSIADAGFVFLCFVTNNTVTLKSCTANDNVAFTSMLFFGGSAILSNCIANSNTRDIAGNIPYGIVTIGGGGQAGEFANMFGCTANSNAGGGIGIQNMHFTVTNNTASKNWGADPAGGAGIALINNIDGFSMSGTYKGNITEYNTNSDFGVYLLGITNSSITNNQSMNNGACDFNQINCSGNTLANNQFGSSCTGL
jgi:hypothetical protein